MPSSTCGVGGRQVLRRRRARPRELRQAADDEDKAGRAERRRLVDRAPVVVPRLLAVRAVGREHAAAAVAGELEPRVLHGAHGAVEPDRRDLVAPGRDRAHAVPGAGLDDGEEVALLSHRRGVEGEEGVVGGEVAHSRLALSFRGERSESPEPINTTDRERARTVSLLSQRTEFMGSGLRLRRPRNDSSASLKPPPPAPPSRSACARPRAPGRAAGRRGRRGGRARRGGGSSGRSPGRRPW